MDEKSDQVKANSLNLLLTEAIPGTPRVWLEAVFLVVVELVCLGQPALWNEGVWVFEVRGCVEGRVEGH